MTRVLVAYGTKMGGTRGIAEVIGEELTSAGFAVEVNDARDVRDTSGFDAVVIGSAIYTARWRPEAVKLLARHAGRAKAMPTWLFQSGPCGNDAKPLQLAAPHRVTRLADTLGAQAPITFGGRIEPCTAKGFIAKKMAKGPLAGDFRDLDRVRGWAHDIAVHLISADKVGTW